MPPPDDKKKPLVLLYSRSDEMALLLGAFLEIWNCQVGEAFSENELLKITESKNPSLVLFDLSLAFEQDLKILRRLRTIDSLAKTPIVVLSGHARSGNVNSALEAGADEYFIKPIDFERLGSAVKKYSVLN